MLRYQNILVPVDGSSTARRGLNEAIELAGSLGSRIRVLHIVIRALRLPPHASSASIERLLATMRRNGDLILREAESAVRASGIEVDDKLIDTPDEHAGRIILEEARSWPAHLIVCGTHGRTGMSRLLLGSDAEFVLRHSTAPVLLVRSR
jgi:nucleotide-binding universal stress UspA family protein